MLVVGIKKKVTNLIELLSSERFRRMPAMYFGTLSFLRLKSFIDGYYVALLLHNIEDTNNFDFFEFNEFVAKKYKKSATVGWMAIIYADNFCDESQSFSMFFQLFDQYIKRKKKVDYYLDLTNLYRRTISYDEFANKYGKLI